LTSTEVALVRFRGTPGRRVRPGASFDGRGVRCHGRLTRRLCPSGALLGLHGEATARDQSSRLQDRLPSFRAPADPRTWPRRRSASCRRPRPGGRDSRTVAAGRAENQGRHPARQQRQGMEPARRRGGDRDEEHHVRIAIPSKTAPPERIEAKPPSARAERGQRAAGCGASVRAPRRRVVSDAVEPNHPERTRTRPCHQGQPDQKHEIYKEEQEPWMPQVDRSSQATVSKGDFLKGGDRTGQRRSR